MSELKNIKVDKKHHKMLRDLSLSTGMKIQALTQMAIKDLKKKIDTKTGYPFNET
jgi:hypothetical protein